MNSKIYNTYIDDFKYINIEKYSIKLFNINFNIFLTYSRYIWNIKF